VQKEVRSMRMLAFLLIASMVAACGNEQTEVAHPPTIAAGSTGQGGSDEAPFVGSREADSSVASEAEGPSVLLVSPRNGQTLPAGDITVKVDVIAFRLVLKSGPAVPGEGRLIFYLDPVDVPVVPDLSAGSGPGTYDTDEPTHTFRNVPPGVHELVVQLIDNDGTPLDPPKVVRVTVNVQ